MTRYEIFHTVPSGAAFTGHLHTVRTREGAEQWLSVFETQGYTGLYIVERTEAARCDANARKGTGTGVCDRPLDEHGQCDRASAHVD